MSRLDLSLIEAGLNTYFIAKSGKNELWDEIVSTNDRAIELSREGAAEGTLVIARQQTGGRGRQGRAWVSPKDAGIFLSFVLRPTLEPSTLPLISFVAAVAAAKAIEHVLSLRIGLKWVNDLVYDGRKLGGILAEMPGAQKERAGNSLNGGTAGGVPALRGAQNSTEPSWVLAPALILGLGINLSFEGVELPEELRDRVESLDRVYGKPVDANQVVSELCNELEEQYNYLRHSTPELVIAEWKSYSITLGKQIRATVGNEQLEGLALDITETGALVLQLQNGETRFLHAGEISIRLLDGSYS